MNHAEQNNGAEISEENTMDQWQLYKETRSTEIRNEIVLQYTGLVKKIVFRFKGSYNNFGQMDDMVNQGMIALIDAVEKFEPKRYKSNNGKMIELLEEFIGE